jgi:aspartokinase
LPNSAKQSAEELVRALHRHESILAELIRSEENLKTLGDVFTLYRNELNQLVKGLAILKELTHRTMDAICSNGERLSSRIVAAGLREAGVDAVWVDAQDVMLTDDNFGRAQPQVDLRPTREGQCRVEQRFPEQLGRTVETFQLGEEHDDVCAQ